MNEATVTMERILPNTHPRALHLTPRTRQIETRALAASAPHALMQRAGDAVARLARAVAPHARTAWIAAGPGNNGGDGLVAARRLKDAGWQVRVSLPADTLQAPASTGPRDARQALEEARDAGVDIRSELPPRSQNFDLCIDAVLGIGGHRAPEDPLAAMIDRLNAEAVVIAVDVPSGLNADTGQTLGKACVRARHTLSLLTLKPGLFTGAGRDLAGTVWLDTLGIDLRTEAFGEPADAWLSGLRFDALPQRGHAQHKGSFGDVAVIGGAPGMHGAAWLAARAAHAAGAGRVYLSMLSPGAADVDLLRPELMTREAWWHSPVDTLARSTVVCGCGGGDAVREVLPPLLSNVPRLVLDADALNAIAAEPSLQNMLATRRGKQQQTVLTPHPLEAARLLGTDARQVQADRLSAAQALADRHECTVILKGSGSVISNPERAPHVNPTGNAALATAGTGDVLAGWLGGQWAAQGHGSDASTAEDIAQYTALQATWLHGLAAEAQPDVPLRAADLVDAMHRLMRCPPA